MATLTQAGNSATAVPVTESPQAISVESLPAIVTGTTVCRFGPHEAYAPRFKVGVGTFVAIGRDRGGNWILIEQAGLIKPCWIPEQFLQIDGDLTHLKITPVQLKLTDKFAAPSGVTAIRMGNQIQVRWSDVVIDASKIPPTGRFLLELEVCKNNSLSAKLIATDELSVIINDEAGCAGVSHGQIYTASKEGYSIPIAIPWP